MVYTDNFFYYYNWKHNWHVVFGVTLLTLWRTRNSLIFEGTASVLISELQAIAKALERETSKSCGFS